MRALSLLVILLGAAACGTGASTYSLGSQSTADRAEQVQGATLTVHDVLGTEFIRDNGLTEQRLGRATAYNNPDPRTACGRKLPLPVSSRSAFVVISGSSLYITDFVFDLAPAQAHRFIALNRATAILGCPIFRSQTPYGYRQINQFLSVVDLPSVGSESFAFSVRVRKPGAQWLYATEVLARRDGLLSMLAIIAGKQAPSGLIAALLIAADRRMAAVTTPAG